MRAVALFQGASYLGFAGWALLRTDHYKRRHGMPDGVDWVLRAHAGWMVIVGTVLVRGGYLGPITGGRQMLGASAAAQLAANDAYSLRTVPPVYRLDLAHEAALVAAWATLAYRARHRRTQARVRQ